MINGIIVQNNPLKYIDPRGLRQRSNNNNYSYQQPSAPTGLTANRNQQTSYYEDLIDSIGLTDGGSPRAVRGGDVYRFDRELNISITNGNGILEPEANDTLSHTLDITTNEDLTLRDTYSWGNEFNKGEEPWFKNHESDVDAAKMALEVRKKYENSSWLGKFVMNLSHKNREALYSLKKVGGPELIPFVERAYEFRDGNLEHPSNHEWQLHCNCKHEAANLINDAKFLQNWAKENAEPRN